MQYNQLMRKNFFIVLVITVIFFITIVYRNNNFFKGYSIANYLLDKKRYRLLVADTPEKSIQGLMFVRSPQNFDGMIFLFPDKQSRSFWNKNTFVDLNLYWLDDDKVVGKSYLPSIEKSKEVIMVNSPKPVDKVIELIKR